MRDKEIVVNIGKAIDASVELRNKKELIEQFIALLSPASNIDVDWPAFVNAKKKTELDQLIAQENLKKDETYDFINNAFKNGEIQSSGTAFAKILPPVSRFSPTGDRMKKKELVLEKLNAYFDRYYDISSGSI